jgi:hypothetical protein
MNSILNEAVPPGATLLPLLIAARGKWYVPELFVINGTAPRLSRLTMSSVYPFGPAVQVVVPVF